MKTRLISATVLHDSNLSDILLLDEFLGAKTPYLEENFLKGLMKFKKGITILIGSHDIAFIENYCSRAYLLSEGNIISEGKAFGCC